MVTNLTVKQLKYMGVGIIGGTLTGYLLQILCQRYLKNHPELLEDVKETIEIRMDNPNFTKPIVHRGGEIVSIAGVHLSNLVIKKLVIALAANGAGMLGAGGAAFGLFFFLKRLPRLELIKWIQNACPANLDSKSLIELDKLLAGLESCDSNLEYLGLILKDDSIPVEDKKELTLAVLTKYLDLKSHTGRLKFVLCIISLLFLLYNTKFGSFYLLLQKLKEAVEKGKISKAMARLILRRLRRKGVPMDPDLLEYVS